MAKQFSYAAINKLDMGKYFFDCSMVSSCAPAFDDCDSNHEVEEKLRAAGVIKPQNKTDTESCALVINFSSEESGHKFIDRLNGYLQKELEKMAEAAAY